MFIYVHVCINNYISIYMYVFPAFGEQINCLLSFLNLHVQCMYFSSARVLIKTFQVLA